MKRALLILLLSTACFGQGLTLRSPLRDIAPAAATSSLLIDENFEGTGTPAGWGTGTGTADFDNTSAPLAGSQDLKFNTSADAYVTNSFTSSAEVWIQCEITFSALPDANTPVLLSINNNVTKWGSLFIATGGGIANGLSTGIAGSGTVDGLSTGTHYWLFMHIAKGTGANGVADVEFSTTSTRVGSGNKFTSISNSNLDGNMTQLWIYNTLWGAGKTFQIDNVKVSNTGWPP